MKVLTVGSGVIGTVYGAHLAAGGHAVSVLRHPPRTDPHARAIPLGGPVVLKADVPGLVHKTDADLSWMLPPYQWRFGGVRRLQATRTRPIEGCARPPSPDHVHDLR
jgi:hypothetical protein